jgi:hypothetical protein
MYEKDLNSLSYREIVLKGDNVLTENVKNPYILFTAIKHPDKCPKFIALLNLIVENTLFFLQAHEGQ